MKKNISLSLGVLLLLQSCVKNPLSGPDDTYAFRMPDYFPEPTYTFANNPITREGFTLGKKLFNDPLLSSDNSIACSNCHVKSVAFTDPQHRLSLGVDERAGIRNAPSIVNMAFMPEFFWDGGVNHLDFVAINAIENPLEMNEKLGHVIAKLNDDPDYPALFRQTFGIQDTITSPYFLHALSQYMLLLVSDRSKYDMVQQNKATFTAAEFAGQSVFENKCSSCHPAPLFTTYDYTNNGLDTAFEDLGRGRITEATMDQGKFKIPTLRNVALTSPYMHDGRFKTLDAVLEHYDQHMVLSPSLDPLFLQSDPPGIRLTADEKEQLKAFLQTLTDYELLKDPIF